jgi:hypothetical protein
MYIQICISNNCRIITIPNDDDDNDDDDGDDDDDDDDDNDDDNVYLNKMH